MVIAPKNIEYKTPAIEAFYREHRVRWEQFYESERVVFTKLGLSSVCSVLDVGCGCGGLGLALRERFGVVNYTGVEINQPAVETAKAMNPAGRFLCADILALSARELASESFDIVVSLSCIDWNVQFAAMLAQAYRYVKPGGYLVASFRLTPGESVLDIRRSYQFVNFVGQKEGEVAPYVVLSIGALLEYLKALAPARIYGFGYWGSPSSTAVTPFNRLCFAVVAAQKNPGSSTGAVIDLDLPAELLETLACTSASPPTATGGRVLY